MSKFAIALIVLRDELLRSIFGLALQISSRVCGAAETCPALSAEMRAAAIRVEARHSANPISVSQIEHLGVLVIVGLSKKGSLR